MQTINAKLKNRSVLIGATLLFAIFVGGSIWWWIRAGSVVSTDDARVKATMTTVSAKVPGRVSAILVAEGDSVSAGQIIAKLDAREYENKVAEARANLAAAKAKAQAAVTGNRRQEIAQADAKVYEQDAHYVNARRNYNRDQALYTTGAISQQQLDASKAAFDSAEAQYLSAKEAYSLSTEGSRAEEIALAQANVQQAEAALKNTELSLEDTVIAAPSDGVIGLKSIEPGELVSTGKPLFNITNLNDIWIGANIEETDIGKIKLGNRASFTIDAYPGVTFDGEVIESGPASGSQFALLPTENATGNFTKVTQRLPIKIRPESGGYTLKPGMSALISVYVK